MSFAQVVSVGRVCVGCCSFGVIDFVPFILFGTRGILEEKGVGTCVLCHGSGI